MNIAIIFAGGSGVRMGAGIPKQFLEIDGKPILIHTLKLFEHHRLIDKIYVSMLSDYIPYTNRLVDEYRISKVAGIVEGGATAQDSIYNALKYAQSENPNDSIVLLHDGVRPFVSYEVITQNIESVRKNGNAITCTPAVETFMLSENSHTVNSVPLRKHSFAAQAPQSFYLGDILGYHDAVRASKEGYEGVVDACTMLSKLGIPTHIVIGNRGNIKVTTPEDVYVFRGLLQYKENEMIFGYGLTNRVNPQFGSIADSSEKTQSNL